MVTKALLLVAFLAFATAEVVVLDDQNFDSQVKTGRWLVEFYAPWCGHCKNLAPTWEELGNKAEGFKVAKLDGDANRASSTRFGIRGFPTIKLIENGKVYDYSGPRTAEAFTEFATNGYKTATAADLPAAGAAANAGNAAPSPAAADANVDEKDVVVLGDNNFLEKTSTGTWLVEFYAPWCGHCKKLKPIWAKAATELKGKVNVGAVDATVHKSLASRFGIRGYPTIKLIKDGKSYDYEGERTVEAFTAFSKDGYSKAQGQTLPGPATIFDKVVEKTEELEVFLRQHILESVIGLVAGSLVLGFLLGRLTAPSVPKERKVSKPAPKKKAAPKEEPESEEEDVEEEADEKKGKSPATDKKSPATDKKSPPAEKKKSPPAGKKGSNKSKDE